MSLSGRLAAAVQRSGCTGAVAGVSIGGQRELAAAGLADSGTGAAMTAGSRIPVASLTKPVLATAIVRLWQRMRMDPSTPLAPLLTDLADDWRASSGISLRHLLSHTSGLRSDIPPGELAVYGDADDGLEQAVRGTVQRGQTFRLGAAWQYCNAGYGLAGYALGYVTGLGFDDAMRAELFEPAGMPASDFGASGFGAGPGGAASVGAAPEAVGHRCGQPVREHYRRARRPGGGLISTVDDMLSFAEFVMADPKSALVTGTVVTSSLLGSAYALGWNVTGPVRWHFGDWGGCHSALLVVPDQKVAVTLVVNDDGGQALRRDAVWAELTRLTGIRRPLLSPAVHFARAGLRTAVASATRPRRAP